MGYCNRYGRYSRSEHNQYVYSNSYSATTYGRTDGAPKTATLVIPWTNFNYENKVVSGLAEDLVTASAIEELRQHIKAIEARFPDSTASSTTFLDNVEVSLAGVKTTTNRMNSTSGVIDATTGSGLLDGAADASIFISPPVTSGDRIDSTNLIALAQKIEDAANIVDLDLTTTYSNYYANGYARYSRAGSYAQTVYYVNGSGYYQAVNCGYWDNSGDGYYQISGVYTDYSNAYSRSRYAQYQNASDYLPTTYQNTL